MPALDRYSGFGAVSWGAVYVRSGDRSDFEVSSTVRTKQGLRVVRCAHVDSHTQNSRPIVAPVEKRCLCTVYMRHLIEYLRN